MHKVLPGAFYFNGLTVENGEKVARIIEEEGGLYAGYKASYTMTESNLAGHLNTWKSSVENRISEASRTDKRSISELSTALEFLKNPNLYPENYVSDGMLLYRKLEKFHEFCSVITMILAIVLIAIGWSYFAGWWKLLLAILSLLISGLIFKFVYESYMSQYG